MTDALLILSLFAKIVGIVFLFAAAIGLVRFSDPFQRMHASTKAGTLGAGFVILGAILQMQRFDATLVGLAAIAFLLVTIPVAGHLLGRAAYMSGADLGGLAGPDALVGILDRREASLEDRARRAEHNEKGDRP